MLIRQHMYFIQLSGSDIDFERNVSGIFDAKKEVDHRKLKFSDGLGGGTNWLTTDIFLHPAL